MENLLQTNTDIVSHLAEFVEGDQFLFFALVCKSWWSRWGQRPKVTRAISADASVSQLQYSFNCGLARSHLVSDAAAWVGRLDLLQKARLRGCPCDETTCAAAAAAGSVSILEFLRDDGCPWFAMTCIRAAEHGHLGVIKYAIANGCSLTEEDKFHVAARAAEGGHLTLLQWLLSEGSVAWNEVMAVYAAQGGQIGVLEWARGKGFPLDVEELTSVAACEGHKNTLLWLRANGFPFDEMTCFGAAQGGCLELLR